jgi:hypothetical protein
MRTLIPWFWRPTGHARQAIFPKIEVLTELSQRANVRFVRFTALDPEDYRLAQASLPGSDAGAPPPSPGARATLPQCLQPGGNGCGAVQVKGRKTAICGNV